MFTKETWKRTYRTFLQAFSGVIAGDIAIVLGNIDLSQADWWKIVISNLIVPAVASGIAAVMNLEYEEMN